MHPPSTIHKAGILAPPLGPNMNTLNHEIGFWCRSSKVGNGYVTEGVKALADMAFEHLKAARVEIRCDQRNLASAAVAKRAGFRLEGILVNDRRDHNDILSSTMIFAKTSQKRLVN